MQKWEYLSIHVKSSAARLRVTVIEKEATSQTFDEELDFMRYINSLGEEGWELVNADKNEYGFQNYFFKRPVG